MKRRNNYKTKDIEFAYEIFESLFDERHSENEYDWDDASNRQNGRDARNLYHTCYKHKIPREKMSGHLMPHAMLDR